MVLNKRTRSILFWSIFALSLFARVYRFGSVPADINQDEAFAGYNAYTLLTRGRDSFGYSFPMYLTAWGSGMNALESYLDIPFILLFGAHTWVLRLVPLVLSMLTLAAVYGMIREHLQNDRLALFTMLLAGVMPWHIMISRWSLESNLAPAFLVFGLFFFLKGTKDQRHYIPSALFYGLSLYCYATLWPVAPFIVLAQAAYAASRHKLRLSGYTVAAAAVLFLLGLPVLLFIMVNKGIIREIRTPFFSVPRMVYYRAGEVSLSSVPKNFRNLVKLLVSQNDGLLWNSTKEYGLFYHFSWPFILIGLISLAVPLFSRHRSELGESVKLLSFVLLVQLAAGLAVGGLISVNVNRVNLLMLPLIVLASCGWYALVNGRKLYGLRLELIPVVFYLVSFVFFEHFYFTQYRQAIGAVFQEGIESCMTYVNENAEDSDHIYISPSASYARVLFLTKQDPDEYLDTVEYTNWPNAYLDVSSFGRYDFKVDKTSPPDGRSLYVLDSSYDGSPLAQALERSGYGLFSSACWRVYYPQ